MVTKKDKPVKKVTKKAEPKKRGANKVAKKIKKAEISLLFVLDASGSMSSMAAEVVSGFNQYVEDLKKDKNANYKATLIVFDHNVSVVYANKPLKDVEKLELGVNYRIAGMTALNDAVGIGLKTTILGKSESGLAVIFTDGQENSSKEYTGTQISTLIEESKNNKWTFAFIGADATTWNQAKDYGIARGSTMKFNQHNVGQTMHSLSQSTRGYSQVVLCSANAGGQVSPDYAFFQPQPDQQVPGTSADAVNSASLKPVSDPAIKLSK